MCHFLQFQKLNFIFLSLQLPSILNRNGMNDIYNHLLSYLITLSNSTLNPHTDCLLFPSHYLIFLLAFSFCFTFQLFAIKFKYHDRQNRRTQLPTSRPLSTFAHFCSPLQSNVCFFQETHLFNSLCYKTKLF